MMHDAFRDRHPARDRPIARSTIIGTTGCVYSNGRKRGGHEFTSGVLCAVVEGERKSRTCTKDSKERPLENIQVSQGSCVYLTDTAEGIIERKCN